MVQAFGYGDWDQICANVPSMPVCSLFLRQQLHLLTPSSYPDSLALPNRDTSPQAYNIALASAGLGVKSVCAIPRMGSAGGYPGSAGNAANIAFCCLAILVGIYLAWKAGKRQAAVARWEMRAFFSIYAFMNTFQFLSTGSFIEQGSRSIVWVTSIHLGLVLLLFWTLAWCTFLCVQLIEDGTLASLIPYGFISTLLFVGFTYICLDTGFSISGYFDTTPQSLHNNWLFTILIVLSGIFVVFSIVISTWVSGMFLRERRPLFLYAGALIFFILSQGAFWFLSQLICISSDSRVDGSFISTICTIISVFFLFSAWKTVTEDSWDEVTTLGGPMSDYDRQSHPPLLGQSARSTYSNNNNPNSPYGQQTTPLQSSRPYSHHTPQRGY